jgi:hypothetical protein
VFFLSILIRKTKRDQNDFITGQIGVGYVEESNTAGQKSPLTIQSTLKLKKGDQVYVAIYGVSTGTIGYLVDDSYISHVTHFTGFMLEEEIVASL